MLIVLIRLRRASADGLVLADRSRAGSRGGAQRHDFAVRVIDYDSMQLAHSTYACASPRRTGSSRRIFKRCSVWRGRGGWKQSSRNKAREIEAKYGAVEEADREKALAREAPRDHGRHARRLGSSLVGLLGRATGKRHSAKIRAAACTSACRRLRLAVDALEPTDGGRNVILGNVRHRMTARRIESSCVRFRGQVGELPPVNSLKPQAVLAIQRSCWKRFTNSHLRHARAGRDGQHAGERGWRQIGRMPTAGIGSTRRASSRPRAGKPSPAGAQAWAGRRRSRFPRAARERESPGCAGRNAE